MGDTSVLCRDKPIWKEPDEVEEACKKLCTWLKDDKAILRKFTNAISVEGVSYSGYVESHLLRAYLECHRDGEEAIVQGAEARLCRPGAKIKGESIRKPLSF